MVNSSLLNCALLEIVHTALHKEASTAILEEECFLLYFLAVKDIAIKTKTTETISSIAVLLAKT